MKKTVVHFEIGCSNLPETVDFFIKIFDWDISPVGNNAPIDLGKSSAITGHINKLGPDDPQKYITIYIETDTLADDLKAIEANGGKVMVPPLPLPDGRTFAWFYDIAGNMVGLISPNTKA